MQSVIYQSQKYSADKVVSVYGCLYSNGEVKMYDVDRRHKTIREWWIVIDALTESERAKLRLGEQVLLSGLTMQER